MRSHDHWRFTDLDNSSEGRNRYENFDFICQAGSDAMPIRWWGARPAYLRSVIPDIRYRESILAFLQRERQKTWIPDEECRGWQLEGFF